MISVSDNNYKESFDKAREIVNELGVRKYVEEEPHECYYFDEFEYGDLKIVFDHYNSTLSIKIDNSTFGYYNYITDKMSYYPSKWTELIEEIYNRIPQNSLKLQMTS